MWWSLSTTSTSDSDIIYCDTSNSCSNTVIVQWPCVGNSEKPKPKPRLLLSLKKGIIIPKEKK